MFNAPDPIEKIKLDATEQRRIVDTGKRRGYVVVTHFSPYVTRRSVKKIVPARKAATATAARAEKLAAAEWEKDYGVRGGTYRLSVACVRIYEVDHLGRTLDYTDVENPLYA